MRNWKKDKSSGENVPRKRLAIVQEIALASTADSILSKLDKQDTKKATVKRCQEKNLRQYDERIMGSGNHSVVTEFILAGLSSRPELRLPLFLLFLGIYVFTVLGNLGMIILILLSSHLHTPMYFFLSSLSFIDFCHSTVITPKMLVNFVTEKNIISYPECMTQLYCFLVFAIAECHMLAAMAYDRYVAICNPLLYNVVMSHHLCLWLTAGVYTLGFIGSSIHTGFMLKLVFCKTNVINHYFCDLFPLLELSCSSIYINELLVLFLSALNILTPALTILMSYIFIIASILRIHSTEGRSKAFSTCSSHISAVAIFFGSAAFMYLQPSSVSSMEQGKVSSVFYTTVVPMLNPLIYSLRNKDVKLAVKKILNSNLSFIDLCYSSVIIPKMLVNFVSEKNSTSVPECMTQLFLFSFFGIDDSYMLTVMAYDRYVAICNPLLYNVTMSHTVCVLLSTAVYAMGAFGATVHTSYISSRSFCGTNVIHHYFCDILPLLNIACSRDYTKEFWMMLLVGFNVFASVFAIFISYAFILASILRIRSAEGRSKAFSTCSSHLAAVGVFYGSIIFMYFKPSTEDIISACDLSHSDRFSVFPYEVKYCSFQVCEELCWKFDADCIESVDCF
ncbi:hypothetical protein STEG23_007227, partial [Scotinomys teguina]